MSDFTQVETPTPDPGPVLSAEPGVSEAEIENSNQSTPTPLKNSNSENKETPSSHLLATDFSSVAKKVMRTIEDYPTKEENHYVWEISDWNSIRKENKISSPQFLCGGFNWVILLFPRGNNDSLSVYVEPRPLPGEDGRVNPNWYVCAQFGFDFWNPEFPESHFPSGSYHRFSATESDWGFSSFITHRDLSNAARIGQTHSILENNKLNITGYIRVIDDTSTGVLWHNFVSYDSKANTGYVGLNNQGATCYLNSLLQSYFTTKVFRNLVYLISTKDNTNCEDLFRKSEKSVNNNAVALAMQRIFYLLQKSSQPVPTLELTKSFGWDSSESFTQHDVQELNRILMDKLEYSMKGSSLEKRLDDIFVGRMKSFIKCVDVPYESSRVEDFWDIQLNVKGFKTLKESFENYIEIELLEGENKYEAGEQYGYQNAKKGVVFESFPPVLHLQLKRFEYDFLVDDLVKIDDFFEFPDSIDLSPYLNVELEESVKSQNWNYKLHGVLVHQGSISNGHYYAMIKPDKQQNTWLRFDDDKVWKVTPTQVFLENFGAPELSHAQIRSLSRVDQNEYFIRRATSAYMLVYYRESEVLWILPDLVSEIPNHISEKIEKEKADHIQWERKKKEMLEYIEIQIVTESNFINHTGFDIYPEPSSIEDQISTVFSKESYPDIIKLKRDDNFSTLLDAVAQKMGLMKLHGDKDNELNENNALSYKNYLFALAPLKHRNNKTVRIGSPILIDHYDMKILEVYSQNFRRKFDQMSFYVLEYRKELANITSKDDHSSEESGEAEATTKPIEQVQDPSTYYCNSNQIVIFLKYFDSESDIIRGVGHILAAKNVSVCLLNSHIAGALGIDKRAPLKIYEEISSHRIEEIDVESSFEKNELSTGDILTVQISDSESLSARSKFKTAPNFYNFLRTRLRIRVRKCVFSEQEEDSDFVEQAIEDRKHPSKVSPNSFEERLEAAQNSFDMWISSSYNYEEFAKEIALQVPGTDHLYLRIFYVKPLGDKVPLPSYITLLQIFTKQNYSSISLFEFEILKIPLQEYENMRSISVSWLTSVLNVHCLELLVPKTGTFKDLLQKVVHKLSLPEKYWSGILVWGCEGNKYADIIRLDRSIDDFDVEWDVCCGYFPAEVEILVRNDMFSRFDERFVSSSDIEDEILRDEFEKAQKYSSSLNIIPVFHFQKSTAYTHSKPFVFAAFPNEAFADTLSRLRKKLGLGRQAFEQIRIALADKDDKGGYIDTKKSDISLLDELGKFENHVSLALDHRDRSVKPRNSFDKGISIG